MSKVVGIDLGTTRSVVASINTQGKPEIIRNEFGHSLTPSVIYFGDDPPVVGDKAREQQRAGKKDVLQLFKRNMDDEYFLFSARGRDYTPIDLSALVLAYMKAQAERFLGEPVTGAVITVPAYFADPQRQATMKAGEQAGLHVLKIISEPTAAALAYSVLAPLAEQRILVYDLGGGTFDISLVSITATRVHVLGTDGNHHLGGADWDGRLLDYAVQQFERDFAVTLTKAEREEQYASVEDAKHALSVRRQATITIRAQNHSAAYKIQRAQFEELTRDLLAETQMLTERLLRATGFAWQDISAVLPVGGASRMPMIRAYLESASGKAPLSGHNPDEIVALGAALQAMRETEQPSADSAGKTTVDAIAHSLGMIVESADRLRYVNSIIIPKNSPIPAARTRSYQIRLHRDDKSQLEVFLTQGESSDPQHCIYLGRYLFTDFPPLTQNTAMLDITYRYDKNGVVQVAALETTSAQLLTLSIESKPVGVPARFARRPIDRIREDALTIYLAVDLSGSMQDEPLETAKRAALSFVERCNLATTSIGLLAFADQVSVPLKATHNEKVIHEAIGKLALDRSRGYGNNGDPFDELYTLLSECWHQRYAVILTDGAWSCPEVAIQRAQRCHQVGINVFALGFGAADRDFLARIASAREQGILTDLHQLIEAFSSIAQEISPPAEVETLPEPVADENLSATDSEDEAEDNGRV